MKLFRKKRKLSWFVDKLLNLFLIGCGLVALWVLLQVTCIATFRIPSDSMEPALLPGEKEKKNPYLQYGGCRRRLGGENFPSSEIRQD